MSGNYVKLCEMFHTCRKKRHNFLVLFLRQKKSRTFLLEFHFLVALLPKKNRFLGLFPLKSGITHNGIDPKAMT